jgi:hypothetical protein
MFELALGCPGGKYLGRDERYASFIRCTNVCKDLSSLIQSRNPEEIARYQDRIQKNNLKKNKKSLAFDFLRE